MSDGESDTTAGTGIAGGYPVTTTHSGDGGAAPAMSALTLRLCLAVFGLVLCTGLAIWLYMIGAPIVFPILLVTMAAVALVDIAVIVRRKRRGEPG